MRVLLPLSLVLGLLPVGALFGVESRDIVEEFEVAPDQAIRITLSVAEVRIATARGNRVKAELTLRCRWNRLPPCRPAGSGGNGLQGRSHATRSGL